MERYDFLFALVCLNAAGIPLVGAMWATRWTIGCFAPMWLTGIVMFLVGAITLAGLYMVLVKIRERKLK